MCKNRSKPVVINGLGKSIDWSGTDASEPNMLWTHLRFESVVCVCLRSISSLLFNRQYHCSVIIKCNFPACAAIG